MYFLQIGFELLSKTLSDFYSMPPFTVVVIGSLALALIVGR